MSRQPVTSSPHNNEDRNCNAWVNGERAGLYHIYEGGTFVVMSKLKAHRERNFEIYLDGKRMME